MGPLPLLPARRPTCRRLLRAGGATLVGLSSLLVVVPAASAAGFPGPVHVAVSVSLGANDFTNHSMFGGMLVQYNTVVTNSATSTSGPVVVTWQVPVASGVLVPASVTCGSVPGCTFTVTNRSIAYSLSSVGAGANLHLSFEDGIIPRRDNTTTVYWTGGGCLGGGGKKGQVPTCKAGTLTNQVIGSPLELSSVPPNRSKIVAGQTIAYTLTVHPYIWAAGSPDVIITDYVPVNTTYVDGSASCKSTPGCTAAESGGVVTFTLTAASFVADTDLTLGFSVVNNAPSATIVDSATFTGGVCAAGVTCPARHNIALNADNEPNTSPGGGTTTTTIATKTATTGPTAAEAAAATTTPTAHVTTAASSGSLAYTGVGDGLRATAILGTVLVGGSLLLFAVGLVPRAHRRLRRVATAGTRQRP